MIFKFSAYEQVSRSTILDRRLCHFKKTSLRFYRISHLQVDDALQFLPRVVEVLSTRRPLHSADTSKSFKLNKIHLKGTIERLTCMMTV